MAKLEASKEDSVDVQDAKATADSIDRLTALADEVTNGTYYKRTGSVEPPKPQTEQQKSYLAGRLVATQIDIISKQLFLRNRVLKDLTTSDITTGEGATALTAQKETATSQIKKLYDQMIDLLKDPSLKTFPKSEAKYIYLNMIGADQVVLGLTKDTSQNKNARKDLAAVMKNHCFAALGVKDLDSLDKLAQEDDKWIMNPDVGGALFNVILTDKQKYLKDYRDRIKNYCFKRLINQNRTRARNSSELEEQRRKDTLLKAIEDCSNLILWTTEPKNPQVLKPNEIAAFEEAIGYYNEAISLNLTEEDLSLLVNKGEIECRLASGVNRGNDRKVADYCRIAKDMQKIIDKEDATGELKDKSLQMTPQQKYRNKVAVMKARIWKAICIISVCDLAKQSQYSSQVTEMTGLNMSSYNMTTSDGVDAMQTDLVGVTEKAL